MMTECFETGLFNVERFFFWIQIISDIRIRIVTHLKQNYVHRMINTLFLNIVS